jgi:PhzF family phenazine biosynthesis protein
MTLRARRFQQVDVFTATPYWGNPLAVVLDGSDLNEADMQRFARWTNLSETTFVLPPTHPEADYRVRIFTPGGELPFAGHPTLGTCHAWLAAGGQARGGEPKRHGAEVVQECKVGLVTIRTAGDQLAFRAPVLQRSQPPAEMLSAVTQALGLSNSQILAAQLLHNGPQFLGLLLDDPPTVLAVKPRHDVLLSMNLKVGIAARYPGDETPAHPVLISRSNREARAFSSTTATAPAQDAPDLEVRVFVTPSGVPEDPVTGSFNASLAQWLMADGLMPTRYTAAQGTVLGRAGRVHLSQDAQGQVWVGGQVVTCVDGTVRL